MRAMRFNKCAPTNSSPKSKPSPPIFGDQIHRGERRDRGYFCRSKRASRFVRCSINCSRTSGSRRSSAFGVFFSLAPPPLRHPHAPRYISAREFFRVELSARGSNPPNRHSAMRFVSLGRCGDCRYPRSKRHFPPDKKPLEDRPLFRPHESSYRKSPKADGSYAVATAGRRDFV